MEIIRKKYLKPEILLEKIKVEADICAGSAVAKPQNRNYEIIDEWEVTTEPTKNIDW